MLVVNKRTGQVEEFSTFEHYMDDELREGGNYIFSYYADNYEVFEKYMKIEKGD